MDPARLSELLISYICLIIVITFHEFGHAWMAWKRGDDTAKVLGRVSLNPIVHIEIIGTVILPLFGLYLSMANSKFASFIIGWGKPVPVDTSRLSNKPVDGTLIAMAGPAMNVIIAVIAIGLARVGLILESQEWVAFFLLLAWISMFLCFFNLLPIPPLDGSHVVRYLLGVSDEAYYNMSRWGFVVVIVILQIPPVRDFLSMATDVSIRLISAIYGIDIPAQ